VKKEIPSHCWPSEGPIIFNTSHVLKPCTLIKYWPTLYLLIAEMQENDITSDTNLLCAHIFQLMKKIFLPKNNTNKEKYSSLV
jgi:hypothetical protein